MLSNPKDSVRVRNATARNSSSTLSPTPANEWYDVILRNIDAGATHMLGGTMVQHVQLIRRSKRDRKMFINLEAHSLVEAMVGARDGSGITTLFKRSVAVRKALAPV